MRDYEPGVYTDRKRYEQALKDWEGLSEKAKDCTHRWHWHHHDIVRDFDVYECGRCDAWVNHYRIESMNWKPLPERSVKPRYVGGADDVQDR